MFAAFDELVSVLKTLPGLGFRSAERVALHLLAERPEKLESLMTALQRAGEALGRCPRCGNLSDGELCSICSNDRRDSRVVCVVESIVDLMAVERAAVHQGAFHVLHGKLSPLHGVGPEDLNLDTLEGYVKAGEIEEVILALGNDIESEATCHYIQESLEGISPDITITRIGFGLPSGGHLGYTDARTLKSAIESRRSFH